MNDLERQLRAALHHATEPAPPGLLAAVMRRHRRHRRRIGASTFAAALVVALAVPPVAGALHNGSQHGGPNAVVSPTVSRPKKTLAAPGTVLAGCARADIGYIGERWRQGQTAHAGPLWFLDGGHSTKPVGFQAGQPLRLYVAVVVVTDHVRPGSVVVVKVARAGRPYLRFLYGPRDSYEPGTRYTMASGEPGVTFEACPPMPPGVTDYYGVFLVRGGRCVPVQVWVPGRVPPMLIHLGACAGQ